VLQLSSSTQNSAFLLTGWKGRLLLVCCGGGDGGGGGGGGGGCGGGVYGVLSTCCKNRNTPTPSCTRAQCVLIVEHTSSPPRMIHARVLRAGVSGDVTGHITDGSVEGLVATSMSRVHVAAVESSLQLAATIAGLADTIADDGDLGIGGGGGGGGGGGHVGVRLVVIDSVAAFYHSDRASSGTESGAVASQQLVAKAVGGLLARHPVTVIASKPSITGKRSRLLDTHAKF
jgi:hypothetical protein